jgi:hypothetical protein
MPCRKTWHANCYECLWIGKFPQRMTKDAGGNPWFKQGKCEHRYNHGVRGAHASIPFQCKDCWTISFEGRLLVSSLDDTYVILLCQANLDAMLGQALTTIMAHASVLKRSVHNFKLTRKMPTIPCRGPMEHHKPKKGWYLTKRVN